MMTVAVERAQAAGSPRTRAHVEQIVAGPLGERMRLAHRRRHPGRSVDEISDARPRGAISAAGDLGCQPVTIGKVCVLLQRCNPSAPDANPSPWAWRRW